MTADNQLEITIKQNLETGEVSVGANGPTTFNVMLRLNLIALKGLKDNLINKIKNSSKEELINFAFGEAFREKAMKEAQDEEELKKQIIMTMEAEMYDMLNLSVSNFLDTEFPEVNEKESLTELAAEEAGLDASASAEDLVQAEKDFIEKHPEEAAKTADLQPTAIKNLDESKLNRAQRRAMKKVGK